MTRGTLAKVGFFPPPNTEPWPFFFFFPLKRSFGLLGFRYDKFLFFLSFCVGYWSIPNLKTAKLAEPPTLKNLGAYNS